MMAAAKETARQVWSQSPLGVTVIGVLLAAGVTAATASVTSAFNTAWTLGEIQSRLDTSEKAQAKLAEEQVAGRARGDALRQQVATVTQGISALSGQIGELGRRSERNEDKLDRLITQRFGEN